jgi:hypothetical protein
MEDSFSDDNNKILIIEENVNDNDTSNNNKTSEIFDKLFNFQKLLKKESSLIKLCKKKISL